MRSINELLACLGEDERIEIAKHPTEDAIELRITKGPDQCLCFNECECTTSSTRLISLQVMKAAQVDVVTPTIAYDFKQHREMHERLWDTGG